MKLSAMPTKILVVTLLLGALAVTDARAAVTSLLLDSEPGDYIGGGQILFFTAADGSFTAQRNFDNGVSIAFNTPTFSHWWHLDFAAPSGIPLAQGSYPGATRFPFQAPAEAGLSVSGDGRGCNTLTGAFEVDEIAYGAAGEVLAFRATFEQHCEGFAPALRGEIRYNATVAIELTAPAVLSGTEGQLLAFAVSASEIAGRHVVLSASGLPAGASFVDHGDNTGTFSWTPGAGQAGSYVVEFQGDNGQGALEDILTRITITPPPPPNDDFARATVIPAVPSTFTQSTRAATTAFDDPFCMGQGASVWFALTPTADMPIEANTFGSDYDTTLSVYTGSRGALAQLACSDNSSGLQSRVRFNATAGVTYFFMVSGLFGSPGGNLVFNVLPGPAPFAVSMALSEFGSVRPSTGAVTIGGTVICSRPAFATVFGQLTQMHGQRALTGFFSAFVPCDGPAPWSAAVQLPLILFHGRAAALFVGGPVNASASVFAFDAETGEFAQGSAAAPLILRGTR